MEGRELKMGLKTTKVALTHVKCPEAQTSPYFPQYCMQHLPWLKVDYDQIDTANRGNNPLP
jgi:hypothetical protein